MTRSFDPRALVEHREFMRSLARSLVADEHWAEDVVQQASLAALQRPPRDPSATRPWLGRVVRNLALRVGRRESERGWREERAAAPDQLGDADVDHEFEVLGQVADALRALPEPYRTTLYLRYYKDLGPRAIAERELLSVETVKTRLRRGLELLRTSLDTRNDGDRKSWALALASFAEPVGVLPTDPSSASPVPGASAAGWTALLEGVLTMKIATVLTVGAATALGVVLLTRDPGTPAEPVAALAAAGAGTARAGGAGTHRTGRCEHARARRTLRRSSRRRPGRHRGTAGVAARRRRVR